MNEVHRPVLVKEVIEYLAIKSGSKIIDATINGGGHTREILEKFQDVKVLGIEWDPEIFKNLVRQLADENERLVKINDSYVNLKKIVEKHDFHPDGILFDLGLSSWHYEESGRGFSFKRNEILDMRFNPEVQTESAADVVNKYSEDDLRELVSSLGEEQFAGNIAKNIVKARKEKPVIMTDELVKVIGEAVPEWYKHKKIHFATKTFQALRIAVNHELENVEKGMREAIEVLNPGGRLVVISFQGLEDKIVKNIFKEKAKEGIIKFVVKGTIKPSWEETRSNPRARSAKMKIAEKI
ncbi:MAG: 16S rRNA (cytosine(1402)-N(4))-methyltransferase RsmH [Candidatus Yanofskybacteria bacterium]|nr:16S rRNA (cytosine(1402)-N(4))-methyltransferase RsmH [Candidatus Yanofskybacteria bacterium]